MIYSPRPDRAQHPDAIVVAKAVVRQRERRIRSLRCCRWTGTGEPRLRGLLCHVLLHGSMGHRVSLDVSGSLLLLLATIRHLVFVRALSIRLFALTSCSLEDYG